MTRDPYSGDARRGVLLLKVGCGLFVALAIAAWLMGGG
jgi:hypothetical protein